MHWIDISFAIVWFIFILKFIHTIVLWVRNIQLVMILRKVPTRNVYKIAFFKMLLVHMLDFVLLLGNFKLGLGNRYSLPLAIINLSEYCPIEEPVYGCSKYGKPVSIYDYRYDKDNYDAWLSYYYTQYSMANNDINRRIEFLESL